MPTDCAAFVGVCRLLCAVCVIIDVCVFSSVESDSLSIFVAIGCSIEISPNRFDPLHICDMPCCVVLLYRLAVSHFKVSSLSHLVLAETTLSLE